MLEQIDSGHTQRINYLIQLSMIVGEILSMFFAGTHFVTHIGCNLLLVLDRA